MELILDSFRPVNAEVDATKLSLAFPNLIENGIKYNNEMDGCVYPKCGSQIFLRDGGRLRHRHPGGVDCAYLRARFYRVDKSHSREIGGTGLGLDCAERDCHAPGAIRVYSKENEGTTFSVRIPLNYVM